MSRNQTVIRRDPNDFDGIRLTMESGSWYQEADIRMYDGSGAADIYLSCDTPEDKKESIAFVDALIVGLREMKKEMRKRRPKPERQQQPEELTVLEQDFPETEDE